MNNAQKGDKILAYDNEQTAVINELKNMIYPIGSIYISIEDQNPSSIFGGTWERFANGRTLVGVDKTQTDFNEVGKTGGEKTHKLTRGELPKFKLQANSGVKQGGGWSTGSGSKYSVIEGNGYILSDTPDLGSDLPHNNLQPYITVYMWLRTA